LTVPLSCLVGNANRLAACASEIFMFVYLSHDWQDSYLTTLDSFILSHFYYLVKTQFVQIDHEFVVI